jgi:hypothetical protein
MTAQDYTTAVEYREIPWASGYRVGSDGTVWSRRTSSMLGKMSDSWRPLKPKRYPAGYLNVRLLVSGRSYYRFVHRLVLEMFIGPCPDGMECRHIDGNPGNNNLSNLAWDLPANNAADKVLHGTKLEGSKVKNAVTDEADVLKIKRLLRFGIQHRILAYAFGVSVSVIDGISGGKSWNHVPWDETHD